MVRELTDLKHGLLVNGEALNGGDGGGRFGEPQRPGGGAGEEKVGALEQLRQRAR